MSDTCLKKSAPANPPRTLSFGFLREDGDFAILATLNNLDGHMSEESFHQLVDVIQHELNAHCDGLQVQPLVRADAPDYVYIDEGEIAFLNSGAGLAPAP